MLEVDNISVSYGDREVLRDVSMTVPNGGIVALLGPNGAGKSTMIRALNGTVPVSEGRILIEGRRLPDLSRRQIAKRIAVVAQENETRFPVTVLEFVLSGRFVHGGALGWETEQDIELARAALRECDLSEFESRLMDHLSGGERQRVVLARALAAGASILLLDEPTANLDLAHQMMTFGLVRKRCRENGSSAVLITHDLNLASEFADQILLLKDGQVAATGEPKEVLNSASIRGVFGIDVLLDANPASGNVRVTSVYQ